MVLFAVQLGACSLPPVVPIPPPPDMPAEWGNYDTALYSGSDCPSVSGTFELTAEIDIVVPGVRDTGVKPHLAYYSVFPFYVADQHVHDEERLPISGELLVLEQPNANTLVVREATEEGNLIVSFTFIRSQGDFECENGFVQFPVSAQYGGGEWVTLNGQSVARIRLTEAGDLVGQHSWGPYRSRSKNTQSEFAHEFFRFTNVD